MSITDTYLRINNKVEQIEKWIAVFIISAIVIIVFTGTITRYVFKEPLFGADRLATYLMIWLGFIGFQIATSKLRHIEIEFIKVRVHPTIKYRMNIMTAILAALFLLIMFLLSVDYTLHSRQLNDTDIVLGIPLWYIILVLPISFLVSTLRFAFAAWLWLDVLKEKRKEEDIVKKQLL